MKTFSKIIYIFGFALLFFAIVLNGIDVARTGLCGFGMLGCAWLTRRYGNDWI